MDEVVEALEKYKGLVPLVYDIETMSLDEARPEDMQTAVYLKREADKVIADLEESHKKEVEQLLMEIVKLKEHIRGGKMKYWNMKLKVHKVWDLRDDFNSGRYMGSDYYDQYFADLYINHQKYKRCLAMARCCDASMAYFGEFHDSASNRMVAHYYKWRGRWYELAEKFKPNN